MVVEQGTQTGRLDYIKIQSKNTKAEEKGGYHNSLGPAFQAGSSGGLAIIN